MSYFQVNITTTSVLVLIVDRVSTTTLAVLSRMASSQWTACLTLPIMVYAKDGGSLRNNVRTEKYSTEGQNCAYKIKYVGKLCFPYLLCCYLFNDLKLWYCPRA